MDLELPPARIVVAGTGPRTGTSSRTSATASRGVDLVDRRLLERFEASSPPSAMSATGCRAATAPPALHLALLAAGVGPGDEVIVAGAHVRGVRQRGAVLRGDAGLRRRRPRSPWTLDPDAVAAAMGPRTRAIMAVHLYGHPADMDALRALADAHGARADRGRRRGPRCALPGPPGRIARRRRDVQLLRQQDPDHRRGRDGRDRRRRARRDRRDCCAGRVRIRSAATGTSCAGSTTG